jgi:hypothetical protein
VGYKGPEKLTEEVLKIVSEEVNISDLSYGEKSSLYELSTSDEELRDPGNQDVAFGEAREIVRKIQDERKKLQTKLDEKVDVVIESFPVQYESYIKKNALINDLRKGNVFQVSKL